MTRDRLRFSRSPELFVLEVDRRRPAGSEMGSEAASSPSWSCAEGETAALLPGSGGVPERGDLSRGDGCEEEGIECGGGGSEGRSWFWDTSREGYFSMRASMAVRAGGQEPMSDEEFSGGLGGGTTRRARVFRSKREEDSQSIKGKSQVERGKSDTARMEAGGGGGGGGGRSEGGRRGRRKSRMVANGAKRAATGRLGMRCAMEIGGKRCQWVKA